MLQGNMSELATAHGADFFGVADLPPARQALLEQGGSVVAGFARAISVGIILPHAIVDQLPQRAERAVAMTYRYHAYELINQRLDQIVSRMSSLLQQAGHRSLPIPASQTVDSTRLCGAFSHKLAAHLAGLGWIGKSCLLVTPQAGPRVRWASLLTAAPLQPTGSLMEPACEECQACVDGCPVSAFSGRLFRHDEPRELRYDAHKCKAYLDEMERTRGLSVCGMCLYACPHGRSASSRLAG
jgi:epoxyqueuosine reductase QueG